MALAIKTGIASSRIDWLFRIRMELFRVNSILLLIAILTAGCKSTATMHAWAPPQLQSTVGKQVVLAKIVGPADKVQAFHQALRDTQPKDDSQYVRLIEQSELQQVSAIQLAAATEEIPSDVALQYAAGQQSIDHVWLGEILESRTVTTSINKPEFTVSWRLMDTHAFAQNREADIAGMPVSVTETSLRQLHPDLDARHTAGDASVWAIAAARGSWRLLTPSVRPLRVEMVKPYFYFGAGLVRQGNAAAEKGDWFTAERIWSDAIAKNPNDHAALHNLALASAARQDFVKAKVLAQKALRLHSSAAYETTVVWIEQRQIELSDAFGLAPPAEGWLFSPDGRQRYE